MMTSLVWHSKWMEGQQRALAQTLISLRTRAENQDVGQVISDLRDVCKTHFRWGLDGPRRLPGACQNTHSGSVRAHFSQPSQKYSDVT